jgi:predicted nucleic acid-binding Zn ribbon protein
MGKDKNSLTSLKDVISELLGSGALPFDADDARIWKLWDDVVGPAIARNAQPFRIKNRQLRVRVSDPIWYQELKFMEESIREKLNQTLGRKAVNKIEFSVGRRLSDN